MSLKKIFSNTRGEAASLVIIVSMIVATLGIITGGKVVEERIKTSTQAQLGQPDLVISGASHTIGTPFNTPNSITVSGSVVNRGAAAVLSGRNMIGTHSVGYEIYEQVSGTKVCGSSNLVNVTSLQPGSGVQFKIYIPSGSCNIQLVGGTGYTIFLTADVTNAVTESYEGINSNRTPYTFTHVSQTPPAAPPTNTPVPPTSTPIPPTATPVPKIFNLGGYVRYSNGVGTEGITVRLYKYTPSYQRNYLSQTTTDANGQYTFANISEGTYDVEPVSTSTSSVSPTMQTIPLITSPFNVSVPVFTASGAPPAPPTAVPPTQIPTQPAATSTPVPAVKRADVVISDAKTSFNSFGGLTLNTTIKNQGAATVNFVGTNSMKIEVKEGDTLRCSSYVLTSIAGLAPQATSAHKTYFPTQIYSSCPSFTPVAGTQYTLVLTIDSSNTINESDESNNTKTVTFTQPASAATATPVPPTTTPRPSSGFVTRAPSAVVTNTPTPPIGEKTSVILKINIINPQPGYTVWGTAQELTGSNITPTPVQCNTGNSASSSTAINCAGLTRGKNYEFVALAKRSRPNSQTIQSEKNTYIIPGSPNVKPSSFTKTLTLFPIATTPTIQPTAIPTSVVPTSVISRKPTGGASITRAPVATATQTPPTATPTDTPTPVPGTPTPTPLRAICQDLNITGDSAQKYDVIFLPQGYTDYNQFEVDAQEAISHYKAANPDAGIQGKFNFKIFTNLAKAYDVTTCTSTTNNLKYPCWNSIRAKEAMRNCNGDGYVIIAHTPKPQEDPAKAELALSAYGGTKGVSLGKGAGEMLVLRYDISYLDNLVSGSIVGSGGGIGAAIKQLWESALQKFR